MVVDTALRSAIAFRESSHRAATEVNREENRLVPDDSRDSRDAGGSVCRDRRGN
jgi:hypothetical protein